jgi:2'-5' RNA ligase superfamily protein
VAGGGLSLWLALDEAAQSRLDPLIAELAVHLHGPRFRAHLTLLPRLNATEGEALARAAELALRTPPLTLTLFRAVHTPAYYRCLILEAQRTPELLGAHQRARRPFAGSPDDFLPHVSVAYGRLPASIADPRARSLEQSVPLPLTVRAERLEVWSTRGDPSRWHALGGYALRG